MLKNDIKHLLRQKQTGFFCKHKKAALSMIKRFHVFLMWKAWKLRNKAAAKLLVKVLDNDQLIHIRGLETELARMWERLKTVHEKTGVTGSDTDIWTQFYTAAYIDSSIPL